MPRAFVPAHCRSSSVNLFHRDAVVDGTHERAQVTPHAFLFDDFRHVNPHAVQIPFPIAIAGCPVRFNALVRSVFASDIAKLTADAKIGVYLGDDLVI